MVGWGFLRPRKGSLGHRGAVLLLVGIIFILVGVNFAGHNGDPKFNHAYHFQLEFAPLSFWGGVFISCGIIACVTAFLSTGRDGWGFTILAGLSAFWSITCMLSVVGNDLTSGITNFLSWAVICGILSLVAGMRGPDDV